MRRTHNPANCIGAPTDHPWQMSLIRAAGKLEMSLQEGERFKYAEQKGVLFKKQ